MNKVFIVRAENGGEPESYLCGLYPTEKQAEARVDYLKANEYEFAWYDEVLVGPNGADLDLCNR